MDRPRRDSRQHNGITLRRLSQLTFTTKSAQSRHAERRRECPLPGHSGLRKPSARIDLWVHARDRVDILALQHRLRISLPRDLDHRAPDLLRRGRIGRRDPVQQRSERRSVAIYKYIKYSRWLCISAENNSYNLRKMRGYYIAQCGE
jgi:hypothetical protein